VVLSIKETSEHRDREDRNVTISQQFGMLVAATSLLPSRPSDLEEQVIQIGGPQGDFWDHAAPLHKIEDEKDDDEGD
jgi:hypothetical protein